jgi:coproporphyrinogen III oxidase-like Fe-S oxidoreductase
MIGIQTASEKVNKLNNRKFSKEKLDKVISEIKKL